MKYVGTELDLFQHAHNWKRYWATTVRPFIKGRVLDVGCGIGTNADHVWNKEVTSYTFLEPDANLLEQVPQHVQAGSMASSEKILGTTTNVAGRNFDTLLYIDVIEHIADPLAELHRASGLLAVGGYVVVVVPAFQILYSPFDRAIGHYRRYNKAMLREHLPSALQIERLRYLDSVGFLLSLGNRFLLRKAAPTIGQIMFWDERIIPISKVIDPLTGFSFGRSLIAVLRRS